MNKIDLIEFINKNKISLGIANNKTELRKINDDIGYGRFACDNIKKDEAVFRAGCLWLTHEEKINFDKDYFLAIENAYWFQGGLTPDLNGTHNHSCDPNCYFEDYSIRALRDIKKDEQLTIDYSSFINHNYVILNKCSCGALNCREVITGKDWLIYDLPSKYSFKVSSEILRHYLNILKASNSSMLCL